ncbi:unnamed protein product [Rotaria sordida]|uniref:Uncharacterized protein n=1 Tax=Rotaria sordida TaxID=392033 RepID=A0A818WUB9_9BILA|nr:unnamed protein product [Rotaria sordida]CAF3728536.1 unnamed protein product [Rotaria sordida]
MEQLFSTWFNESDHHYDDDGSELIDYVVEKYDASRSVWQRNVYNDPCKFTYTNAGFAESVAHHFHIGYVNVDICQFTIKDLLEEDSYLIETYSKNFDG